MRIYIFSPVFLHTKSTFLKLSQPESFFWSVLLAPSNSIRFHCHSPQSSLEKQASWKSLILPHTFEPEPPCLHQAGVPIISTESWYVQKAAAPGKNFWVESESVLWGELSKPRGSWRSCRRCWVTLSCFVETSWESIVDPGRCARSTFPLFRLFSSSFGMGDISYGLIIPIYLWTLYFTLYDLGRCGHKPTQPVYKRSVWKGFVGDSDRRPTHSYHLTGFH